MKVKAINRFFGSYLKEIEKLLSVSKEDIKSLYKAFDAFSFIFATDLCLYLNAANLSKIAKLNEKFGGLIELKEEFKEQKLTKSKKIIINLLNLYHLKGRILQIKAYPSTPEIIKFIRKNPKDFEIIKDIFLAKNIKDHEKIELYKVMVSLKTYDNSYYQYYLKLIIWFVYIIPVMVIYTVISFQLDNLGLLSNAFFFGCYRLFKY